MQVYIYQADLHCKPCIQAIKAELERDGYKPENVADEYTYDSDNWPKGPDPAGESDTPQHCGTCGMFLKNSLTSDGEEYVRECAMAGGNVPPEWREYYDYLDIP
jgi:hypothetical protein